MTGFKLPVCVDQHIVPFNIPVNNFLVVKVFQTLKESLGQWSLTQACTSSICLV